MRFYVRLLRIERTLPFDGPDQFECELVSTNHSLNGRGYTKVNITREPD